MGWQKFGALTPERTASTTTSALEELIRKYTSTADIRGVGQSAGKIRMIWLNKELLTAILQNYGQAENKSAPEMNVLKAKLERKLDVERSIPFLVIIEPERGALIGRPEWAFDPELKKNFPSILLRGTGNKMGIPHKWQQILGEGNPGYFSGPTFGYVLYRDRVSDGTPLVHPDELSFSVEYRAPAVVAATEYALEAEFHFDLMPIDLIKDLHPGILSWNNSIVRMNEKPQYVATRNTNPAGGSATGVTAPTAVTVHSQTSATELSHQEILQIMSLALSFAEFLLKLAA